MLSDLWKQKYRPVKMRKLGKISTLTSFFSKLSRPLWLKICQFNVRWMISEMQVSQSGFLGVFNHFCRFKFSTMLYSIIYGLFTITHLYNIHITINPVNLHVNIFYFWCIKVFVLFHHMTEHLLHETLQRIL